MFNHVHALCKKVAVAHIVNVMCKRDGHESGHASKHHHCKRATVRMVCLEITLEQQVSQGTSHGKVHVMYEGHRAYLMYGKVR
jgi:hypothetical protein